MHDFYKERGLEVPKPGKFGCIPWCIYRLKNTNLMNFTPFGVLFGDSFDYFMIKEKDFGGNDVL